MDFIIFLICKISYYYMCGCMLAYLCSLWWIHEPAASNGSNGMTQSEDFSFHLSTLNDLQHEFPMIQSGLSQWDAVYANDFFIFHICIWNLKGYLTQKWCNEKYYFFFVSFAFQYNLFFLCWPFIYVHIYILYIFR